MVGAVESPRRPQEIVPQEPSDLSTQRPIAKIPPHVPPDRVIDFDAALDPGLKVDVFRRLAEVRDQSPPIAFSPYNGGHWLVFDTELIRSVLLNPAIFTSTHISTGSIERGGPPMIPLGMDPPEHGPWRVVLTRHLGPSRVRELEGFIRAKAEELIASVAAQATCDFVKDVAEPFPISVFMALMGLPTERFPEFRQLAVTVLSNSSVNAEAPEVVDANQRIIAILGEVIAERSQSPRDDLISALMAEEVNGQPIQGPELMSMCYLLFLGGLDTVTNALSFGIRYLAQHPTMLASLRANPEGLADAIEDLLSLTAFVNTNRMVTAETELGGVVMKPGDVVWNITWAGCNDAQGLVRQQSQPAFGGGPHICAGMHLARLELRIFYQTWLRHITDFGLQEDSPAVMKGGSIMEIKSLPLTLKDASQGA